MKLLPAESVRGVTLTDETQISALAGWPARNIVGLMPKDTRDPVWA
jgi:hypothetical protein